MGVVLVAASSLYTVQSDAHLKDIVDTAVGAGNFNTLAAALTKANLVDTLKGAGPFTVFAPTDAAFEKALAALGVTAEQLLARADLAQILTYHVASGKVLSTDLQNDMKVTTLQSQPNLANQVTVTIDGATVKIGDATVTTADLECSNGVIHVIDTVLLPAQNNIVQTAVQAGTFNTLAAALTKANLVDTLSGAGPFTVFAPTDAAFEKALKALGATAEELLARKDLADILKYHVASGKTMSTSLKDGMKVATLQGEELTIKMHGKMVHVNDATVSSADIEGSNGVIHVIDAVLLPPAGDAPASATTAAPQAAQASAAAPQELGSLRWVALAIAAGIGSLLTHA